MEHEEAEIERFQRERSILTVTSAVRPAAMAEHRDEHGLRGTQEPERSQCDKDPDTDGARG
jgi:hypothetical protein